ncbi:MAG: sulfite exporter TauE/SafE family protein [Gemmataceae bacterium]
MLPEALLLAAAFLAGAINTVAGGGTLLTFPSLLRYGLDSVRANATSTLALLPASLAGAWGLRRELAGTGPWLWLLGPPSLLGGAVGSLLMTGLDKRYFEALVPWLLLTASLLFLAQPWLANRFVKHPAHGMPPGRVRVAVVFFQFLVAVYGGYFGAGIGILMLTALAFMGLGDIHRMNAVKGILAALINGVAAVVFAAQGVVEWRMVGLMAVAGIGGGLAGAAGGRLVPKVAVRWFVIAVGLGLAAYYFLKRAD